MTDQDGGNARSAGRDESSRIAETDHRVANHLALLAGALNLKIAELARRAETPTREDMGVILRALRAQIEAVGDLHRRRADGVPGHLRDVGEHLGRLCRSMTAGLGGDVVFTGEFDEGCLIDAEAILPLTQVLTEVLSNAIRHGRRRNGGSAISARCHRTVTGGVLIEVGDDGPGFPEGFDATRDGGMGLRLIRAVSRQLGGVAVFGANGPGLCFRLELPPRAVASDA